jgi:glycosyltransferase involved in cell wall biosynthesis
VNPTRVGLIGPVLPYRGGIAQYTTRLHRALAARTSVTTLSFSRQYPSWLFPGESDRDREYEGHSERGVEYIIDPLSPRSWARGVRRLTEAGIEALIVPWWTVYFAPCFFFMTRALKRRGCPVVFLCHNVVDHEAAFYKRAAARMVLNGATGYCVHSRGEARRLAALVSNPAVAVHPHPLYDQYPTPDHTMSRRAPLELLFFGFVRPYKGVDVLIEAMAQLRRRDVRLSIVGEFWQGLDAMMARLEALGLSRIVEVVPRFVPEQAAAEYFGRADLVVLPYRHATGSGVVAMAVHYGKPVLASRVGGLEDVVLDGQTGFLVEPGSAQALARRIDRITAGELEAMRLPIERFKARMTWDGLVETLLGLFAAAPARTDGPPRVVQDRHAD